MLAYSAVQDISTVPLSGQTKPIIWVLHGQRIGDNAQADALAARLEGNVCRKPLEFNLFHGLPNLVLGSSTLSLKALSRKELAPPWPDLVIATGKRSAPIARWIKRQSNGKSITVQLGRARIPYSTFDLMITTPQYGLPPAENVVEIRLPFAAPRKIDHSELHFWSTEWANLQRPLVAVVVGNAKHPLKLGRREGRLIGQRLNALAEKLNGSVLIIASPRTDRIVVSQIESELTMPHMTYPHFNMNLNPYGAAMVICDRFVTTSDSISVISELITTGRPVDVFELPIRMARLQWRAKAGIPAWLSRTGVLQPPRDVSGVVRRLIEDGHLNSLGDDKPQIPFGREEAFVLQRLNLLLHR